MKTDARNADARSNDSRFTRRRMAILLIVIPAILLAANWFVCATWNHFLGTTAMPAWQFVSFALILTFIGATILGFRYSNFALRFVYRISAVWLGVLSFSFFAACAVWIISAAAALFPFHYEPKVAAHVLFGLALLASICGLLNASWLRVTRITVHLPNLPATWHDRTVALVTDLHLGNVRGVRFASRVVAKLRHLQPDAVFISGDLFDGIKANLDALAEPWKQLAPPAGIYFVTGNHEEFTDRAKFINAVQRAGVRVLNNEKVDVQGLQIIGVHDGELDDPPRFRALLRQVELDRGRASILLGHQPSNLAISEEEGISLQLSGHTHGGQIWPWTLVAACVHGRFIHGLNRFGELLVYTSNGIGTWGAPMRLGTKSEIVLIRLEPATKPRARSI